MATTPLQAAATYAATNQLTPLAQSPKSQAASGEFEAMVTGAIDAVAQKGAHSNALTADVLSGKGDVVGLVTAMAETELAVETLVNVRDKVISAYKEILNMPI